MRTRCRRRRCWASACLLTCWSRCVRGQQLFRRSCCTHRWTSWRFVVNDVFPVLCCFWSCTETVRKSNIFSCYTSYTHLLTSTLILNFLSFSLMLLCSSSTKRTKFKSIFRYVWHCCILLSEAVCMGQPLTRLSLLAIFSRLVHCLYDESLSWVWGCH